jgi:hypothetical protein
LAIFQTKVLGRKFGRGYNWQQLVENNVMWNYVILTPRQISQEGSN